MSIHLVMRPVRRMVQCEGIVSLAMPCYFWVCHTHQCKTIPKAEQEFDTDWKIKKALQKLNGRKHWLCWRVSLIIYLVAARGFAVVIKSDNRACLYCISSPHTSLHFPFVGELKTNKTDSKDRYEWVNAKVTMRLIDAQIIILSPRTTKLWRGYRVCPIRMYVHTCIHTFVCIFTFCHCSSNLIYYPISM